MNCRRIGVWFAIAFLVATHASRQPAIASSESPSDDRVAASTGNQGADEIGRLGGKLLANGYSELSSDGMRPESR